MIVAVQSERMIEMELKEDFLRLEAVARAFVDIPQDSGMVAVLVDILHFLVQRASQNQPVAVGNFGIPPGWSIRLGQGCLKVPQFPAHSALPGREVTESCCILADENCNSFDILQQFCSHRDLSGLPAVSYRLPPDRQNPAANPFFENIPAFFHQFLLAASQYHSSFFQPYPLQLPTEGNQSPPAAPVATIAEAAVSLAPFVLNLLRVSFHFLWQN